MRQPTEPEKDIDWWRTLALQLTRRFGDLQSWPSPERMARAFHEAYERLAPSFGYETRKAPWEQVPENNRKLMIAVCEELFGEPSSPSPAPSAPDLSEFDRLLNKYVHSVVAAATERTRALDRDALRSWVATALAKSERVESTSRGRRPDREVAGSDEVPKVIISQHASIPSEPSALVEEARRMAESEKEWLEKNHASAIYNLISRLADALEASYRWNESVSATLLIVEQQRADLDSRLALATADTERLDWLDAQKVRHHATWDSPPAGDGEESFGGPAFWRNPSVSWTVHYGTKDGTYTFPPELATLSIRAALDAARSSSLTDTPEGA